MDYHRAAVLRGRTERAPAAWNRSEMPSGLQQRAPRTDPDLEFVRRVAQGDGAACAELVDRHLGRITAFAARMLGERAEAEEVAQEVFLRVWKHADNWEPGRALFSTWLHKVALNLCYDRLRRRRETALPEGFEPEGREDSPETALRRKQRSHRVARAVASLPERQRAAIALCHYQELGNIEAAGIMNVSVEALESLLARGRRRLRELLEEEYSSMASD